LGRQLRDGGTEPPEPQPNAFLKELSDDATSLRGAAPVIVGGSIGLVTKALLDKSPVAFKTYGIAGSAIALGVYEVWHHGADFANALGFGQDEQARADARTNLLKEATTVSELGLGFTLGAVGGTALARTVPKLTELNSRLVPNVEHGARWLYGESHWMNKGGSIALGSDLLKQDGRVNLMGIADRFNQPWQGVEHIRAFDFAKGRATTAFTGMSDKWAELPFQIKPNQLSLHIHPPDKFAPTVEDFAHTDGLAMFSAGDKIVLFKGWHSDFVGAQQEFLKAGKQGTKPLTAMNATQEYLHIDKANQTAEIRSKAWIDLGSRSGWTEPRVRSLDYQAVTAKLSDFEFKPDAFKDFLASLKPATTG
jgi:hypothetical protein